MKDKEKVKEKIKEKIKEGKFRVLKLFFMSCE